MSRSNLPPVRHLPQWTRLSRIGRPRSPRRLAATQRPVHPPAEKGGPPAAALASRNGREEQRAASMQRNLEFLQQQHGDTLRRLHAEIERLRRENKGDGRRLTSRLTEKLNSSIINKHQFNTHQPHKQCIFFI